MVETKLKCGNLPKVTEEVLHRVLRTHVEPGGRALDFSNPLLSTATVPCHLFTLPAPAPHQRTLIRVLITLH